MISIIIPTYNHLEPCLKPCVTSMLKTNLRDSEVVIVCNGCKDGSEDYVKSLGKPFRLVSTPEALGYTKAINLGIVASNGDKLVLMNDDNVILDWGQNWLQILEDPLDKENLVMAGSSKDVWAKGMPFLVFSLVMIRRKTLYEFGLLDEAFNPGAGEDCDFSLKCLQKGYKYRQVPKEFDCWKTEFPMWHAGHVTCCGVPNWDKTAARNTKILEDRYPRTEADRELQKAFSRGLQP